MNQNKNRRDKNFIPSDASPRSSREGCLCKNGKTYSTECCDGSVQSTRYWKHLKVILTLNLP